MKKLRYFVASLVLVCMLFGVASTATADADNKEIVWVSVDTKYVSYLFCIGPDIEVHHELPDELSK